MLVLYRATFRGERMMLEHENNKNDDAEGFDASLTVTISSYIATVAVTQSCECKLAEYSSLVIHLA